MEEEGEDGEEEEMTIFGDEDLQRLEEPKEELPSEYKRYMTWKI